MECLARVATFKSGLTAKSIIKTFKTIRMTDFTAIAVADLTPVIADVFFAGQAKDNTTWDAYIIATSLFD